jgi:hydroxyacylglutathione hydrolase
MLQAPIIVSFRCRSDNVGVLVHDPVTGATAAIDAPDAATIRDVLEERNWRLTDILVTHHHPDHVEGIEPLARAYRCQVTGPALEAGKIGTLERAVTHGDRFTIGALAVEVIGLAGHTLGHVGYLLPDADIAFVGDTLFELGSGRIFEGTPADMWAALSRIKALPDATQIFFGHDYGRSNARFALSLEPDNRALISLNAEIEADAGAGRFRSHTTLGREKALNPFLRADTAEIAAAVDLQGAPPEVVLAEIRARKNRA